MSFFDQRRAQFVCFEDKLVAALETWASKATPLSVGLLITLLTLIVSRPDFERWSWHELQHTRAHDYLLRCADPLTRDLSEPVLAYRLTLPIISWLLRLPPVCSLALPYVATISFLTATFVFLRRHADGLTGIAGSLILGLSWSTLPCNWIPGEFSDTFSHLCAVVMMLTGNGVVAFFATVLGLFNDERMIVSLVFVGLWRRSNRQEVDHAGWIPWLLSAILGCFAYAVGRHALTVGWIGSGIVTPQVYRDFGYYLRSLRPEIGSWASWLLNVVAAYRWGWAFLLSYIWMMFRRGARLDTVLFAGFVCIAVFATFLVYDIGRSVGYLAPALLVSLVGLRRQHGSQLSRWLVRVPALMLLSPVVSFSRAGHPLVHKPWISR